MFYVIVYRVDFAAVRISVRNMQCLLTNLKAEIGIIEKNC